MTKEEIPRINEILQALKQPELKVSGLLLSHSPTIYVSVQDCNSDTSFGFSSNYCVFFEGHIGLWPNVKLVLEYVEGIRKLGKRNLPENLFVLKDTTSGFSLKSRNFYLRSELPKQLSAVSESISTEQLQDLELIRNTLQDWMISRIRIVDSDISSLIIRIDNHLYHTWSLPINYKYIDLSCEGLIYMNVDLFMWETTQGFTVDKEGEYIVLTEKEHNYQIKCKFVRLFD